MRLATPALRRETGRNMTAMIDVVFLLITFFMVVAEIGRQNELEDLRLPDIRAATPQPPHPAPLVVNITHAGVAVIAGTRYRLDRAADGRRLTALLTAEARLARAFGSRARPPVTVRADERCLYRHVKTFMTLCVRHDVRFTRLAFAARPAEPGGG